MRLLVLPSLCCLLALGCSTRAVPKERTFVDPRQQMFQIVQRAIANLDGRVVAAMERAGTVTAEFSADVAGLVIVLDVRLERRGFDETVVHARVHGGREEADAEIRDRVLTRFYAELAELADRSLPGRHAFPTPEAGPTSPPWPGAPGRG